MSVHVMPTQYAALTIQPFPSGDCSLPTELLANDEHQQEVLAFLAERPLHTVFLAGYIRDNNLVSPLNRASFYACRDNQNHIARSCFDRSRNLS